MLKKLKLLKKPLFQKRRWTCDFPPRRTRVAQKDRTISRREKMAFSAPVGLTWHSPPPPRVLRTDGRTDGRSRDYYVTTKISRLHRLPNFLSNGAPRAGFARRLRYEYIHQLINAPTSTNTHFPLLVLTFLHLYLLSFICTHFPSLVLTYLHISALCVG